MDYSLLLKNPNNLLAHTNPLDGSFETLLTHIYNSLETFEYLNSEYEITEKLKKSFKSFKLEKGGKETFLSNKATEFIKTLFVEAIPFHDIGKVNPKYQSEKLSLNLSDFLKEEEVNKINPFLKNPLTSTYHSIISSLIYIDYFLKIINTEFKGEEKIFLIYILFCFANTIKSHHGELKDLSNSLGEANLKTELSHLDIFKDYMYFYNYKFDLKPVYGKIMEKITDYNFDTMQVYIWTKILYSSLVSSDFIATYSFYKHKKVSDFVLDNKIDLSSMKEEMSKNPIKIGIESYETNKNFFKENNLPLINELRSDMAIESSNTIKSNKDKFIYMLESPTGGGKTFMSLNCSLEILSTKSKLIFGFPVNTLSSQTKETLNKVFKDTINIQELNSVSPLPVGTNGDVNYQKVLLDKQLWNYQGIVTSNIALFNLLFSNKKEPSMGLISLFNSVIILDEIQNYKNSIWRETIEFLYKYSEIMNIKIIIMSATLPNLEKLIGFKNESFVKLIKDTSIYFKNPLFKERVSIDNSLINMPINYPFLLSHLTNEVIKRNRLEKGTSKVIVEFITKKSCKEFYKYATENLSDYVIYQLDGDTNCFEKERIIKELKERNYTENVLLCTTQVVEAGVDIDMDIGYKDAVFPDVDEQFLGRINRSALKSNCSAFFFNLDKEEYIYKGDYRLYSNISNSKYYNCLLTKDFSPLYTDYVFSRINIIKNKTANSIYSKFINRTLKLQDFKTIYTTMQLIDNITFSVFIPSIVNGVNGEDVWNEYLEILEESNYAKKKVLLINIRERMSYFMYSIYGEGLDYEEAIGGIYYLPNARIFINGNTFDSEGFKSCYSIKK